MNSRVLSLSFPRLGLALPAGAGHLPELALTVVLWQASAGIFLLSLVQKYLPEELGANAAFPGYAMAAYGMAKFVGQIPAGWLADRLGRRLVLSLGGFLALPALVLMMQVRQENAFLAFSALYGLSGAALWPALLAHVADSYGPSGRGKAVNLLNMAQMAGLGLGVGLGIFLVDFMSYAAAFAVCLGVNALAFVITARHLPSDAGLTKADPRRALVAVEAAVQEAARAPVWTASVLILAAVILFVSLGISFYSPALGAYSREVLRMEMSQLALLLIGPAALAAVIVWRVGHLADRFGRQKPLMAGLAVCALSLYAITQTSSAVLVVHLAVLGGLAYAVCVPAWSAAALDATAIGSRGVLLGVLTAIQGLGTVMGQALGGTVGEAFGPLAPFRFAAIMLGVALVLTFIHMQHQRHRTRLPVAL